MKAESRNHPLVFRIPEQKRLRLAILLSPFALLFLAIGILGGMNYLSDVRYSGPRWPIFVAVVAAVHFVTSSLVYLARWHRCHSHASVQGTSVLITLLLFFLTAIASVLVFGIH